MGAFSTAPPDEAAWSNAEKNAGHWHPIAQMLRRLPMQSAPPGSPLIAQSQSQLQLQFPLPPENRDRSMKRR